MATRYPTFRGTAAPWILNASYRKWDFNYSFIYTGERYMLGNNTPVNYIQPWYTHDMSRCREISHSNTLSFVSPRR